MVEYLEEPDSVAAVCGVRNDEDGAKDAIKQLDDDGRRKLWLAMKRVEKWIDEVNLDELRRRTNKKAN